MKGLDTNVLVRYLVADDRKQADRAASFMEETAKEGKQSFINCLVLCELVWVLDGAYGYRRSEISDILDKILATRQFTIECKDTVFRALHDYANGKADFADYLIGRINVAAGCSFTATFDKSLADDSHFGIL